MRAPLPETAPRLSACVFASTLSKTATHPVLLLLLMTHECDDDDDGSNADARVRALLCMDGYRYRYICV